MKIKMSVDPASWDLAEHFMQDRPRGMSDADVKAFTDELAAEIQLAVEDWFEDRGRNGWALTTADGKGE